MRFSWVKGFVSLASASLRLSSASLRPRPLSCGVPPAAPRMDSGSRRPEWRMGVNGRIK